MRRSFIFFQGPQSPFFHELGNAISKAGHLVRKVHVCGGDEALWQGPPAVCYSGWKATREAWPAFVAGVYDRFAATDIVLLGDWRPMHLDAVMQAKDRGIRIWVLEEGYLRPNWITIQEGGVNGTSQLPKTPEEILAMDAQLANAGLAVPEQPHVPAGRDIRLKQALLHHLGNTLKMWKYPWYRTHRPYAAGREFFGHLQRLLLRKRRAADSRKAARELDVRGKSFYFMPLQLDADSQIRRWSPFAGVLEAIGTVVSSFVRHAPENAMLVVKNHPLDNGLISYRKYMRSIAAASGCTSRMRFLEDGVDTDALIRRSLGVVLCNSTVGLSALRFGKPVYCLGNAIYQMPGLASGPEDMPLADFWRRLPDPDMRLVDAFVRILKTAALAPGNFYSPQGRAIAVEAVLERLGVS